MAPGAASATVSVVTISYNQAAFLERALTSVLDQAGVDIDYIVIDPGSTDGSREIIEKYRSRLSHVVFEKDDGPADGLNRGLALARGEYFYYLNSDDEVLPGAFAEAISAFERKSRLDVVYANGLMIDPAGRSLRRVYSARVMSADLYARGLATLIQQSTFFRTAALRGVGGFNVANRTCWDGEAVFDIARRGGRFGRVWADWGAFRIHEDSITGSGRLAEAFAKDHARISATVLPSGGRWLWTRLLHLVTRLLDWRQTAERLLGTGRAGQGHRL